MHASLPTALFFLFGFLLIFFSYLLPLRVFFSLYYLFSTSCVLPSSLLFMATPFYTICHHGIYLFCPSTVFSFLWASLQDCLLICQLSSHYFCLECVGRTIIHFQIKLLALFLTFLCSCFTLMDKDQATSSLTSMACIKWSQPLLTSLG